MPNGVDISEFQASTPGGFEFYIIRTLNESGRQDYRWQQHHAAAAGKPRGAYGIIRPWNIDPNVWADRFIGSLHSAQWELVPTVDIELGDPEQNRVYAAVVAQRIRAAGFPVVMGYYSAGSTYRWRCQDLFDRQWLASWGSAFPAGAHVHQYQGSPLDLDYCPDLGLIGGGPSVEDDLPYSQTALNWIIVQAIVDALTKNEDVRNTIRYLVNTTPVHEDGTGNSFGSELGRLDLLTVDIIERLQRVEAAHKV